ncbi:MAG: AMP-binding protein [Deltaproteobacteria bacterium]|nr:AMP-binding protein [Deltaproteobacteria bacterium]
MFRSMNMGWLVKRWSELQPHKIALWFEGQGICYAELNVRVDQVCCWMESLGLSKGDRVGAMMNNCPEFLEIYLACSRLGAIFVPVNYRLATAELDYTLMDAQPRLLVFGAEYEAVITGLDLHTRLPSLLLSAVGGSVDPPGVLNFREQTASFTPKRPFSPRPQGPADAEEPQVIMYTSGTTGRPKGAVLSHRKTFFNCLNADIFFQLKFDDIMLIVLPLFHSGGLFIQASPMLFKGGTLVIHSRFDALKTYEDIERYQATKFLGVPTVYRALLKVEPSQRSPLASLKVCAIGGEKTTPDLLVACEEAGFSLRQIMGQTETSILLWASEEASLRKPGTVGRPVFHGEVAVVDEQGQSVPPGEVGEIVSRGSIMMTEYWRDPEKTAETIRNGWLHTGDLAHRDDEGYFYLKDRVKDMYISGGENVYPAEVERVLRAHPHVADAAVVGVPDDTWGQVGHAFLIPKDGLVLSPGEVTAHCEGKLARYKWPRRFSFCREFPRTSLGKVRKNLLVEMGEG